MSERKFSTVIDLDGSEEEVDNLERALGAIAAKDNTFVYGFRHQPSGMIALVVYSRYQSQAKKRGEWLTNKVEQLQGKIFRVTLDETKIHAKETVSLQEYEKSK